MGELPLFELKIDFEDETGVELVSLVDRPAIMVDWQAFNKSKESFKVISKDKKIIAGFAMIANQSIYRNDGSGEYNVFFSKDTITQIVQKFFKTRPTDSANIMHTDVMADGTYIIESFQIDKERGILTPKGFAEQEDGSWFVSMKVDSDKVWQDVLDEKYKGFSIEGIFEHVRINNNQQMNKTEKTIFNQIKQLLSGSDEAKEEEVVVTEEAIEVVFGEAILSDGTPIRWEGTLEVGTAILVVTEEGDIPAPDGEHELADGTAIVKTEGGLVTEIMEMEVPQEEVAEEPVEEVADLAEVMREAMSLVAEQLEQIKKENNAMVNEMAEFRAKVEKDLEEKSAKIIELGTQEIATPVTRVAQKPIWKKY